MAGDNILNKYEVAVLLGCYNGEKYIEQQLLSLAEQTFKNFKVYIRDDGSSDSTLDIIRGFSGLDITILTDGFGNLGPARSFLTLLKKVEADVYFFCDQDDYWLPHKIEKSLNAILSVEQSVPALVHSDLSLVDENLETLGTTFHNLNGKQPDILIKNPSMYLENCVVGCTMGLNQAAKDISLAGIDTLKDSISMHDWWIALCVRPYNIFFLKEPLLLYRQHQNNVSGASINQKNFWSKLVNKRTYSRIEKACENVVSNTSLLLKYQKKNLNETDLILIKRIRQCYSQYKTLQLLKLYIDNVAFSNAKLNIAMFFYFILTSKK